MLEYNLIQEHRPRFNIRYRDDKSYPYLALTVGEQLAARAGPAGRQAQEASATSARTATRGRSATRSTPSPGSSRSGPARTPSSTSASARGRPCLYYDIGRCAGPCVPDVHRDHEETYRAHVDAMADFLAGNAKPVLQRLEREMREASAREEFEQAAKLRDQLFAARRALESQEMVLVAATGPRRGRDGRGRPRGGVPGVLRPGRARARPQGLGRRPRRGPRPRPARGVVPRAALHGARGRAATGARPRGAGRPGGARGVARRRRRGTRVAIGVPERGAKRRLLEVVDAQRQEAFHRHKLRRASDFGARSRALAELADQLGLEQAPLRIECYDISNLGPTDKVGSMVVFEDGLPKRSDYRRFEIKGVPGQDDFASHGGDAPPPLHPALKERDGGAATGPPVLVPARARRGRRRARAARRGARVLAELGLSIPHVGLAKRLEEVYFPDRPDPLADPARVRGAVRAAAPPRRSPPVRGDATTGRSASSGRSPRRSTRSRASAPPARRPLLMRASARSRGCGPPSSRRSPRRPGSGPTSRAAIHDHLHAPGGHGDGGRARDRRRRRRLPPTGLHDHHRAVGRGPLRGGPQPRGPRLLRRGQPAARAPRQDGRARVAAGRPGPDRDRGGRPRRACSSRSSPRRSEELKSLHIEYAHPLPRRVRRRSRHAVRGNAASPPARPGRPGRRRHPEGASR